MEKTMRKVYEKPSLMVISIRGSKILSVSGVESTSDGIEIGWGDIDEEGIIIPN